MHLSNMDSTRPILSICLPTNGVVEWVIPTLESIYTQGVDFSLFEVVITDNGENSQLGNVIKKYNYPNLRYVTTSDKGFLNIVTCLQKGRGSFNKMLNHRMMLKPGMLQKMIDIVEKYKDNKYVLYFLNGSIKNLDEFTYCRNLDEFVYNMHYWVSWSAGIGFWDIDLPKLSQINPNEMFPNTSLLFEHRQESEYVIWNGVYGQMQDDSGKGGYDLFHTFGVVFLDLCIDLKFRKRISERTYQKIKLKNKDFLTQLYFNEVINSNKSNHNFIIKDIDSSILSYYSKFDLCILKIKAKIWCAFKRKIISLLSLLYKR